MTNAMEQPAEQSHANHKPDLAALDWPVRKIPDDDFSSSLAATRIIDLRGIPQEPLEPVLSDVEREMANQFGTLYTKFDEDLEKIKSDAVNYPKTSENVPHFFAVYVIGALNRKDQTYNLGLVQLTDEGFEDLSDRYLPEANWKKQPPSRQADKPTSHGDMTDSGKIMLPNPFLAVEGPMSDRYWDPKSAAANDDRQD
ncbi:MAG: hypothetical protein WAR37_01885 [Candidatus Microsaccharimonas sp.]